MIARRIVLFVVTLLGSIPACGGEAPAPKAPAAAPLPDLDGDAATLLPPGALAAATVDMRAVYDNRAYGQEAGQVASALLPLGADAGFVPSRDVDRVTVGWYTATGADFVAVVRGRVDSAAIQRAAEAHAGARGQGIVAATPYSGHTMYTVANVGISVLTPHTVLAGTSAGLRLALDRVRDGSVRSDLPPAMASVLATPQVVFAFAADFGASGPPNAAGLPIPPWVTSVKTVQATGASQEGQLRVTGTASFADAERASSAASGMKQVAALVNAIAMSGVVPELKNVEAAAEGASVKFGFGLDESKLGHLLQQLPQWIPKG